MDTCDFCGRPLISIRVGQDAQGHGIYVDNCEVHGSAYRKEN